MLRNKMTIRNTLGVALTVILLTVTAGVSAQAENRVIKEGETCGVLYSSDTVDVNYGTVSLLNGGKIVTNYGTVEEASSGLITDNYGTVLYSLNTATVAYNYKNLENNQALVYENKGVIGMNTGTVQSNSQNKNATGESGIITDNYGTVEANWANAVITNNYGKVERNEGTIINQYYLLVIEMPQTESGTCTILSGASRTGQYQPAKSVYVKKGDTLKLSFSNSKFSIDGTEDKGTFSITIPDAGTDCWKGFRIHVHCRDRWETKSISNPFTGGKVYFHQAHCAECDRLLEEEECVRECTSISDTQHKSICVICQNEQYAVISEHSGPAATETMAQTCTECGYVMSPALGHVHKLHLTHISAKAATCTKDGNREYYVCSCGQYFKDSAAAESVEWNSLVIPAAHTWESDYTIDLAATCYAEGSKSIHCAKCSEKKNITPISKLSHTSGEWKKDASGHWKECTVTGCGAVTVAKTAHTPGAAATEETSQVCTTCGYVIRKALGHVHALHLTNVNAQEPTCAKDGNYAYYVCDCGALFEDSEAKSPISSKADVIRKATGAHIDNNKDWSCDVCGKKLGNSPTPTNTPTPTPTNTPTPTGTPGKTPTPTPGKTPTPTPDKTPTPTPDNSPTPGNVPTPTPGNTPEPDNTPTPGNTPTPDITPGITPETTPEVTPESGNIPTKEVTPTGAAAVSPTPTPVTPQNTPGVTPAPIPKEPEKSGKKLWGLFAILAAVIACAGGGIWLNKRRR